MYLDPLLLSYKDPKSILVAFATEYCRGDSSASGKNICSHMVEDAP